MDKNTELPLRHVRVIDFGQQIAGPAVAMVLADQGATVIHIDPPSGPQWKHPANAVLNRNKLSLKLNLKTADGLEKAKALIDWADVVIENFRPGTLANLGIDFEQLRAKRPELITISIPGFASSDSLRRGWKATEAIVTATCGGFNDMGFNRVLMGINPSFSPLPLGSSYATSLAAASVVLALLEREKTGRGDHIEVPIAAALMEGLSYNSYLIENMPLRYINMREAEIARRKQEQLPMDLSYDDLQEYLDPFFRTYQCADARFFYCVCPSHRNHAKRCLRVLGIYDQLVEMGLPDVEDLYQPIADWDGETSIGVYPLPKKWAHIISERMKKAFLTRTSAEWGVLFGQCGIPGAPHRNILEWIHDEHTTQSGLMVKVNDPEYGEMLQPGPLVWFEYVPESLLQPKPRRTIEYDNALILLKQVAEQEITHRPRGSEIKTASHKAWLDGLRVLDLTNVIAGPHSCAFLSRFGAEVIKLDPVTPMYDPLIGIVYAILAGNGKKSTLVDIITDEGRSILHALIRSVDLIVINAPERQIKPLGLDQKSLQTINPDVLFCRLDCFGGPQSGPKSDYIGYDDIIQAASGIMTRFGGAKTPEEHAHIGTLDVNCGFAAGLSIALALLHKHKTGKVSRCRTSLSAITNLAQTPFSLDYHDRVSIDEPSGRNLLGRNELSRFYQTQDGWIFLDSTADELTKMSNIKGLENIESETSIATFLTKALKQQSSEYWTKAFQIVNIAAAAPWSIEELRSKYTRPIDRNTGIDRGSFSFSFDPNHPSGHSVTQIDNYAIRPSEASIKKVSPTERFGSSTREVLKMLGYNDDAITDMIERKIIGLNWGKEYLPS
ncbi:CoA transferase [Photobacterium leiognathi]|uniref:Carnitine dehydratase n=2 Tax=Photobacterium leiognathi TaxID=553611 RepID=A0A2T3M9Q5_PHOLE|nr:CoA transferase [Photobacterium leiognathi]PSV89457.1 carnitine dehydratase [Photobacterium leiognathi]